MKETFELEKIAAMVVVLSGVLLSQITGKTMFINFYRFIIYRKKE